MAGVNTLGAYELLRRAIEQQKMQQAGAAFGSAPNDAQDTEDDGSPQGGLVGRLLALQAEQSRYQPVEPLSEPPVAAPRNPGFRQLTRRFPDPGQMQAANWPSNVPDDQSSSASSPQRSAPFDMQSAGGPDEWYGVRGDKVAPPWFVPAPTMATAATGWRIGGLPLPVPPMGPGTIPQIPMPHVPESWKMAWKLLQLFPRMISGAGSGGGDGGDDCDEERQTARGICEEAAKKGWRSNYAVGPYKKSSGEPWRVEDCMRGLVSERCGGNELDR